MHPLFEQASGLTQSIIGGAIEVHKDKGPGLIESIYEWCLLKELEIRRLTCVSQRAVIIEYKGFTKEETLRFDLLVESCVLVEAKSVEKVLPIHKAQLLSYTVHSSTSCVTHSVRQTDRRHSSDSAFQALRLDTSRSS